MAIAAALRPDESAAWYVHRVYLGRNCWGITQASRLYFGKTPDDLAPQEAALLAGIVAAPARFDPEDNPARAIERRTFVLSQMASAGVLTEAEAAGLATLPLSHQSPLGTCVP
jgi:penicillin-binding protein 1A